MIRPKVAPLLTNNKDSHQTYFRRRTQPQSNNRSQREATELPLTGGIDREILDQENFVAGQQRYVDVVVRNADVGV